MCPTLNDSLEGEAVFHYLCRQQDSCLALAQIRCLELGNVSTHLCNSAAEVLEKWRGADKK